MDCDLWSVSDPMGTVRVMASRDMGPGAPLLYLVGFSRPVGRTVYEWERLGFHGWRRIASAPWEEAA